MTELSPQIVALLKDPRHLTAALDVRAHLERVEEDIKLRFCERLRVALDKKLADSDARHRWQVDTSPEYSCTVLFGLIPLADRLGFRCLARLSSTAGEKD
ncbi:hypothetical protein ABIC63_002903 [Pseudacidovorax sp. 1753]|uniref:hypothetical protein n=1 Tax=Pseudacidovorax sp. 1753 TaxID=3156419 RepID=UPI00339677AF